MIKNMVRCWAVAGVAALTAGYVANAQVPQFDGFIEDPTKQKFNTFDDSPDWKFFRTPAYCYATKENERGTLLVGHDRRQNRGHVAFWNKTMTGYRTADTTYLEIVLFNIIPGVGIGDPDRGWGSKKFVVAVNRDGQRVFNTKLDGAAMLETFGKFDRLVFMDGELQIVQNFALTHGTIAMARLRACVPH